MYALGKGAGVSQAQLSRFMSGKRTLTLPAVERICRVLRLDLAKRDDAGQAEAPPAKKRKK
jgi:transcriptional regulator with XRE-family HTH domain